MYSSFPKKYEKIVKEYSEEFDIDEFLIYAVIKTESGFNPSEVSYKGAVGLMQIMPKTAEFISENLLFEDCAEDLKSERANIRYGARYLKYLVEKFGELPTAISAYNAGEGKVLSWLNDENYSEDGKTLYRIPYAETAKYTERVLRAIRIYKFLYNLA